eukprot:44047-Prorocentrum_minimum.AAC.1
MSTFATVISRSSAGAVPTSVGLENGLMMAASASAPPSMRGSRERADNGRLRLRAPLNGLPPHTHLATFSHI